MFMLANLGQVDKITNERENEQMAKRPPETRADDIFGGCNIGCGNTFHTTYVLWSQMKGCLLEIIQPLQLLICTVVSALFLLDSRS